MPQIDYYFTPRSPFVYLAGQRLEEIAARTGATIVYKPVDPNALFPRTGGKVRAERHPSRNEYRDQDLARQARKLGLPIDIQPMFLGANVAPAAYAIIAAQQAGGGDTGGLAAAFSRAIWAEGRDISDDAVVRAVLAAHGFDPAIADRGMLAAAETYAANLEEAVSRGVFGIPFYVVGAEKFWGQDRLGDLDLHLQGRI
ncbi:MAG: 2-hydroxychromene-2-carboxylate isomerase [Paracoccaceae bacterium]